MDILIGFSFPVNSGLDSLHPNFGLPVNGVYPLLLQTDTPVADGVIVFINGVYSSSGTDYAATATHWDSSANNKYWMIKLKSTGFENMVLYSAQRSGENNPSSKYFRLQYRVSSSETWYDFGDSIEVAND